mgnify:CR=1 FL=1
MNPKTYIGKLTVIVVSFYSNHIIENLINKIDKSINILIIENSLDYNLKSHLEKKFTNVQVIIPEKNLGVGGGINLGFSLVKTKFALHLSVDTVPNKDMISILLENAEKIKNFSILAPKIQNFSYGDELYKEKNIGKGFHKMKFIIGAALLFDMKSLEKTGGFDENIFLYYEEHDLYYRCLKLGLGIYLIDDAKIIHHGSSSISKKYSHEISLNRNWHYCWSKFYYFKKNFGYFYALKKIFPNLIRSIKRMIFCKIRKEDKQFYLYKNEFSGILSSILNKPSDYRPFK